MYSVHVYDIHVYKFDGCGSIFLWIFLCCVTLDPSGMVYPWIIHVGEGLHVLFMYVHAAHVSQLTILLEVAGLLTLATP